MEKPDLSQHLTVFFCHVTMCTAGHFDSKAMPSAGLLPFFQSMFCAANNTCYPTERPSEQAGIVNSYNNSLYVSLQSCPDDGCKTVVLLDTLDSDFVICLAGSAPLYLLLCSRERL